MYGGSLSHGDNVAGRLFAGLKGRGATQPIAQAVTGTQVVPNAIDDQNKRTCQKHEVVFVPRKSGPIVDDALVGRDLALDHFELQLPAGRRKSTTSEALLLIRPYALVSVVDKRGKVRLERRQKLGKRQCESRRQTTKRFRCGADFAILDPRQRRPTDPAVCRELLKGKPTICSKQTKMVGQGFNVARRCVHMWENIPSQGNCKRET